MRLLRSTDLALRVLMRLATTPDTTLTTREVADGMGAPYSHAAKVVAELQHMGLIVARRGRGGGLGITEKGRAATVGTVVRRFEGEGDVAECTGVHPCPLVAGCRLRGALRDAQEAFYATLDDVTIADMTRAPTRALLQLAVPGDGAQDSAAT